MLCNCKCFSVANNFMVSSILFLNSSVKTNENFIVANIIYKRKDHKRQNKEFEVNSLQWLKKNISENAGIVYMRVYEFSSGTKHRGSLVRSRCIETTLVGFSVYFSTCILHGECTLHYSFLFAKKIKGS